MDGIAVVFGMGKTQLAIPWAILTELGIPTFVVFDGDAGRSDRVRAKGESDEKIAQAQAEVARENRTLLEVLGAPAEDHPATTLGESFAVFHDTLEVEADAWEGYAAALDRCRSELGDWRGKSEDVYRLAAATTGSEPPEIFVGIVEALRGLAR